MRVTRGDSADWLASGLEPTSTVLGTVPSGFDRVVRILHAPLNICDDRVLAWRDVSESLGTVYHPGMQWTAISRQIDGEVLLNDGTRVRDPEEGRLTAREWSILSQHLISNSTSEKSICAFWVGWDQLASAGGDLDDDIKTAIHTGDAAAILFEQYALVEMETTRLAAISAIPTFGWGERPGLTPNFAWDMNRSWIVSTSIDFDSTLIGCGERVAEAILTSGLEAVILTDDIDLSRSADTVNGASRG